MGGKTELDLRRLPAVRPDDDLGRDADLEARHDGERPPNLALRLVGVAVDRLAVEGDMPSGDLELEVGGEGRRAKRLAALVGAGTAPIVDVTQPWPPQEVGTRRGGVAVDRQRLFELHQLAGGDHGMGGHLLGDVSRRGRSGDGSAERARPADADRLHRCAAGVPQREGELHRLAGDELGAVGPGVERHAARDEQRLLADGDLLGEELGNRPGFGEGALHAGGARPVERGEGAGDRRRDLGHPIGAQARPRRRDVRGSARQLAPHLAGERRRAERRRQAGERRVDAGEEIVAAGSISPSRSLDEGVLAVARPELEQPPHVLRAMLAARFHRHLQNRQATPGVDATEGA